MIRIFNIVKVVLIVGCLLAPDCTSFAQTTRIKGIVSDSSTGEPIPFAGIYLENTQTGVSSDLEGKFFIETRDTSSTVVIVSILGYEQKSASIRRGAYNELFFEIAPISSELTGASVKPDDRKVKELLANIQRHLSRNNPDNLPSYECETYTRTELDIIEAEKHFSGKTFNSSFGFVFDYVDTSVVNGRSYLPALLSETIAKTYHRNDPPSDKEVVSANRISGIPDTPSLSQFLGSLHVKSNLYQRFIDVFEVQIPSPLSSSGHYYYNYYLIDSLDIAGRKTYKMRFHPMKNTSTPAFDGEMNIDAEDFALQEAHFRLVRGPAVNFIHELVFDVEYQKTDSVWFYKSDRLFAEFSPQKDDSYKILSFFGTRQIDYSSPAFSDSFKSIPNFSGTNILIKDDAVRNDESYWERVRPYPLSDKEQGIYRMVDQVQSTRAYKSLYMLFSAATNGFFDIGQIGLGPYYKAFSFNNVEGARFQLGTRTSLGFSKKQRYTGYLAYGIKDKKIKGGATGEFVFNNYPTRKLTLSAKNDLVQLGRSDDAFVENNIMSSIMSKGSTDKLSLINEISAIYEHEFHAGFETTFAAEIKRIYPSSFVPMVTPSGESLDFIGMNQLRSSFRFSWDEVVTRGNFEKYHMYSEYPIITVNLLGSIRGLGQNTYSYFRPEIDILYKRQLPPLGVSTIHIEAGKIFGQVPYQLLKLHEGNGSYFMFPDAYSCMDYYEFASDMWANIHYFHDFKGVMFGKIPLLKKLGWRENFIAKIAWGTLSKKNDGSKGIESQSYLLFPELMSSLEKPYVELGIGVSNIFQVFRIDVYRRMTHKRDDGKNTCVNLGMAFSF